MKYLLSVFLLLVLCAPVPVFAADFYNNLPMSYLQLYANNGNSEAQKVLGDRYWNAQNFKEAVTWYRKAAEQGHAEAQYNLGFCYHNGEGVQKNFAEAAKWNRKSADQGFAWAEVFGDSYWKALNFKHAAKWSGKDLKDAISWWYREAARRGYGYANGKFVRLGKEIHSANNRILYLAEEKLVVSNGVTEKIETTIPFVVDIATNTVILPEKYSNNLQYNKDEFTEKDDTPSLSAQYANGTLQLTIKSTFRPAGAEIDNMVLPQEAWANGITIEENKDTFNYRAIIKYAIKDKSQLQPGLKVTIKTASGHESNHLVKETDGKMVVEEYKAAEF